MRHVIAAIQVVIDKYLPVTVNVITLGRKVVQLTQPERSHALWQSPEKLRQRSSFRIQIHKNKLFPSLHLRRDEPVVLTFEVLDSIELRHPLKRPIQPVIPSVIWTMQDRSLPARLRHHR